MQKIKVLSEELIGKIAAGEVVENPASVVKELVENAIDASATEIRIEVENGGKKKIRVADNGTGMSAEDAKIAWQRHTTSKIST
ncbi:MAG: ATP-binding protein, partial [Thermoplasmata archaeon]